jgi:hypothetical protein
MNNLLFRYLRFPIVGVVLLSLWACAGAPMKGYTGPALPPEKIAVVRTGPHADLVAADDTRMTGTAVTILPGEHKIVMKPNEQQQDYIANGCYYFHSKVTGSVSFVAEAGHNYLAYVSFSRDGKTEDDAGTGFTWTGIIEDQTTHKKVGNTGRLELGAQPVILGPAL